MEILNKTVNNFCKNKKTGQKINISTTDLLAKEIIEKTLKQKEKKI
jgi:hypothetical protein